MKVRAIAGLVVLAMLPVAGAARAAEAPMQAPASGATDPAPDWGDLAQRLTESMTRDLGLSVIQIPEVEKANRAAAAGFKDAASSLTSADKNARKVAMQLALQAFSGRERDLKAILTPDQWARFDEERSERGAEVQSRLMRKSLALDDAQASGVESLNLEASRKIRSALAPARLPGATRQEKMASMRTVREIQDGRDQSLKAILKKDQWKKYQESREELRTLLHEARRAG